MDKLFLPSHRPTFRQVLLSLCIYYIMAHNNKKGFLRSAVKNWGPNKFPACQKWPFTLYP